MNARLKKVQDILKSNGLKTTLITNVVSIEYLIDRRASHVFERLFALLVPDEGMPILYSNALFPIEIGDHFILKVHTDADDPVAHIIEDLPSGKFGVDRFFSAQFLLPILDARPDVKAVIGSFAIDEARRVKTEEEQEKMRRCSHLNDEVFDMIPALMYEGMTETELSRAIVSKFIEAGGSAASSMALVCFGANSAEPHHMSDDTKLERDTVVLVDGGMCIDGYFSDMTRTFYFSLGDAPFDFQRVYEIVKEANRRGKAAVKPGVPLSYIDEVAREYITQEGYGEYFTHRLGHGIGRDVHEEPSVSASSKAIAEPGMCFSIEPGIYIPGKFGVRIEDLVLVTETGCEVLNRLERELITVG